ncbi:MAG TPA: DUF433 domain-containing protein [Ktedonobacteraceae bacterium]|nr:DUF433 domain-containing protein [Ktedonobacteraceae bacterium]
MDHPLITTNPGIAGGKPIVKGTRITVELLVDEYAAGRTIEQILRSYPHLTREQIEAAFVYNASMKQTGKLAG